MRRLIVDRPCTHACTGIHKFIVASDNFRNTGTGKWFRIERRQVVFICWMQDSNPGCLEPILQQTECLVTNRLSYRGSSKKLNLNSPSLWPASIQPISSHCRNTYTHTYILFLSDWNRNTVQTRVTAFISDCRWVFLSNQWKNSELRTENIVPRWGWNPQP